MKKTTHLLTIAICLVLFAACKKSDHPYNGPDYVFTLSNDIKSNQVLAYKRAHDGMLSFDAAYATGGTGTGGGLGNQGAIAMAYNNMLLAINAGSNSLSAFKITHGGIQLKSTIASGGEMPVSVTAYGPLVFVLNAGGDGNISGFALDEDGSLQAIPNSTRPLSAAMSGAAQVSFVNDGKVLAITEKGTNTITTYTVSNYGNPGAMHQITSANATPFGFAVSKKGYLYVSEAAGGNPGASTLSSYKVSNNGTISLADGPESASQTAACWVVLTDNEKYAYTTNTGSNNISAFRVSGYNGNISVSQADAATSGMGPIDAAFSSHSKYLYVLNAGNHTITAFETGANGSLNLIQTITGIPAGATGLAAE